VLNLGGIANVTLLTEDGRVSGFDTGPANTLLDAWCRHHDRGHYDAGGDWASQGTVDEGLLAALLADDFFSQPPPRSTGPEHFNMAWLTEIVGTRTLAPVDVQATLSELSARSAADAIQQQLPGARHVIVCGGGVHNADLMRRLRRHLHPIPVSPSNEHGINPDWIEAIGFAWLGRETVAGRPGNAQAVTGARHQAILGGLYRGS
jgi:anhydro-N-acetylmuramic acid kinase